jgi:hypothetical protein
VELKKKKNSSEPNSRHLKQENIKKVAYNNRVKELFTGVFGMWQQVREKNQNHLIKLCLKQI